MATSIVSNPASYYAQQNLLSASAKANSAIARLSSGQRIITAADDVAALSIGTVLKSSVSTLKTALTNTQQANSLLQVADGGLKNIGEILQRQKALSVQANSGTLSDTERSYLNQEFQSLTDEIDRLVSNTKFNSVKLLDGSLSASVTGKTYTLNGTTTSDASGNVITLASNNVSTGDKIKVAGITVEFTNSTAGTSSAAGKVQIGATATGTVANLAWFLNNYKDARLAGYQFAASGLNMTANSAFGYHAGTITLSVSEVTDSGNFITAADGSINTAGSVDGIGIDRYFAMGDIQSSLVANGGATNVTHGQPINLAGVSNNIDFIGGINQGKIGKFTVAYAGTANSVNVSLKVGDITYTGAVANIAVANSTSFTLTGYNDTTTAGGSFSITLKGGNGYTVDSQGEADNVAIALNAAFEDIQFQQMRDVSSFYSNEIVLDSSGEQIANLSSAKVDFKTNSFDSISIEDVRISAPTTGGADATFEVDINGETYRSYGGIGTQIDANGVIALGNINDQSKAITISLGTTALAGYSGKSMVVDSQARADLIADALKRAFGFENGKAKIEFQTGLNSDDAIGVELVSSSTSKLYNGQSLNLLTAENAATAGTQLDLAISTVTSLRADVGALQSRFNYASSNLQVSIQNQDAARGVFLDADISTESTNYANAQVLLQASISVLAQANQLPQNLLKLIG